MMDLVLGEAQESQQVNEWMNEWKQNPQPQEHYNLTMQREHSILCFYKGSVCLGMINKIGF